MIAAEVKAWLHAEPFRSHRIALADQQSVTELHPDYPMVSPDRRTALLDDEHHRFNSLNAQPIRLVQPAHAARSGAVT